MKYYIAIQGCSLWGEEINVFFMHILASRETCPQGLRIQKFASMILGHRCWYPKILTYMSYFRALSRRLGPTMSYDSLGPKLIYDYELVLKKDNSYHSACHSGVGKLVHNCSKSSEDSPSSVMYC
jgi:hypothetical protein